MDQPSKVANPARDQLNRENNIPLYPCVPENLVSRDGFSHRCLLTGFLPSSAAASIYETATRHRVSPEFIGSRNCVPMAFTAESPQAQGR